MPPLEPEVSRNCGCAVHTLLGSVLTYQQDSYCVTFVHFSDNLSTNETLRKLVSTEVWQRLRRYFPDAPEFDQDQQMCQICRVRTTTFLPERLFFEIRFEMRLYNLSTQNNLTCLIQLLMSRTLLMTRTITLSIILYF